MEAIAAAALGSSPTSSSLIKPSLFRANSAAFPLHQSKCSLLGSGFPSSARGLKHSFNVPSTNYGPRQPFLRPRRSAGVKASSEGVDSSGSSSKIAPLQLESPIGQFLSEILRSHPHLLPAAVEQQLEKLKTDRDAEDKDESSTTAGTELVLYRRISELKANERKRTLEEILYALVVQKFMDADVPLVPTISQASDPSIKLDRWSFEEDKFERLHSPEACEMIKNHLRLILGQRLGDSETVTPISKLRVGQVYAASIMYGYFLKRVDQRFQLEKSMRTLPWGSVAEESAIKQVMPNESETSDKVAGDSKSNVSSWSLPTGSPGGFGFGIKPTPLRTYVMSFDAETLQRYATVRSKEAFGIIEKHTEALFGRPEIVITPEGTIDTSKDELIKISFAGLKRLIMEAVTFGSFLWDVESYVDARYHFVAS